MEFINILLQSKHMKEVGSKIIKMDMVFLNMPMEKNMKGIGLMIKDKLKESLHSVME